MGIVAATQATDITRLLKAWGSGDAAALEQLVPLVYRELRRLARRRMRAENPGGTLQTTALVNEAYLRLVGVTNMAWQDRVHFFAVSAQIMRRILVDAARSRVSARRGGPERRFNLDEHLDASPQRARELIALDDSLNALAQMDPRKARVVELRFFGGLSVEEAAEVLKISPQSVMRDWKLAKAWLGRELGVPTSLRPIRSRQREGGESNDPDEASATVASAGVNSPSSQQSAEIRQHGRGRQCSERMVSDSYKGMRELGRWVPEKSASVADTSHAIAGSRPILSFTAFRRRCLQPR